MVSRLRRAQIPPRNDPHDWNSWDNYQHVHHRRLSEHHFVVGYWDTLVARHIEPLRLVRIDGYVRCRNGTVLEVTKELQTRYDNAGRMSVRCYLYRYIGIIPGRHLLLKYHNLHENLDHYVHRVYDPATGVETFNEVLQRYQFPTFPEVLDELAFLAQGSSAA